MAVVGEATIKLNYDGKDAKLSLQKAESNTKSALSKIGGVAKSTGKAVGLTLASALSAGFVSITKFSGDAIQKFAEFEQLAGGVETLFGTKGAYSVEEYANVVGKSVDKVKGEYESLSRAQQSVFSDANEAYKTAGLSANAYMEQANAVAGALLQSTGGDAEKASKLANKAIIDMSDNANKMGIDLESIQHAYQGFAKQNFTMLDNLKLGYGGTKSEMERLLADAEKLSGKKFDISSYGDIVEAIHVVQENMHIAGTTADEAMNTISGSANMVKASWENILVGIADDTQDFDKLVNNFVDSIMAFAKNILPVMKVALKGVANLIKQLVPKIVKELPALLQDVLPALIDGIVQATVAIMDSLPTIMPILVDGLVLLVTTLIPYIPQILGAFFNAIIASVSTLFGRIGELMGPFLESMAQSLYAWLSGLFDSIGIFFGDFAESASKAISEFAQGFWKAIENIKNWFAGIPAFFASVIAKITDKVKKFGMKVGEVVGGAFKAVVNGVLQFIENLINAPVRAINGLIDTINSVPGIDLDRLSEFNLPRLAKGGVATGSTLANIGEAGDEAVIPLERDVERWAVPMAKALAEQFGEQSSGSGITVYMTNNINNNLDADEIGRRLMTSIRRAV